LDSRQAGDQRGSRKCAEIRLRSGSASGSAGPDNRAVGPRRSTSCLARVRVSFTLGFLHRSREGFL
jgi:hypothetical protein